MFGQATNWLDALVHAWSDWMWGMSLHVTWLVVLLWLMDRWLKRCSARLRHLLWCLVLMRLIVPPTLALPTSFGWWYGDWFAQFVPVWSITPTPTLTDFSTSATAMDSHSLTSGAVAGGHEWLRYVCMMWLGFALAQLIWMMLGWLQVRRWLAQSVPLSDMRSQLALASALRRVGIGGRVDLRDSGQCVTPLVIGCLRPVILLPTAVRESLTQAELESVLVHELTHIARRDGWWRVAQALLGILYFFHPAVWLARYKLNQLCEEACDEQTVLALSGERRDYAHAIVKAATIIGYQPPHMAMNMVGAALPVKRRLQRILDPTLKWNAGGGWQRGLISLLLALVLLPSGYRSSQATPPSRMRQAGLPAIDAKAFSNDSTVSVASPDVVRDEELERLALTQLQSSEFETRIAAYETLETVGSLNSLQVLESAFLNRRGIEQDAAKRALDRVWSIIRQQTSEASQTSRQFQTNEER